MWENWEINNMIGVMGGTTSKNICRLFRVELPITNDTFWILINILQIRWRCTLKILSIYQNSWQLLHYWWNRNTIILTCMYEVIFDQTRQDRNRVSETKLKFVHISKKMCNCQSFQLLKLFSHFRNYRRQF